MARRGWVAAEVAPGTWRRLVVFDDGWVELPGAARALSDTRRDLRQALTALGVFFGAFLLARVLDAVGAPGALVAVVGLVALGVLLWGGVRATRARWRGFVQRSADADQARRERDAGARVRLAPGADRWRRTSSARELADALVGVVAVDAADVVAVEVGREGDVHVVTVRIGTSEQRVLRSPDDRLPELLRGLAPR